LGGPQVIAKDTRGGGLMGVRNCEKKRKKFYFWEENICWRGRTRQYHRSQNERPIGDDEMLERNRLISFH